MPSTSDLIDHAISSAMGGEAYAHMISASQMNRHTNEKSLRLGFAEIDGLNTENVKSTLRSVNGFYNTRYAIDEISPFAEILVAALNEYKWSISNPPKLLTGNNSDTAILAGFVKYILQCAAEAHLNRPYSLLTKWLHFRYPESFAIYDIQAAASIQEWSYFIYPISNMAISSKFAASSIADTSGEGYGAVLDFYRECWKSSNAIQRHSLKDIAEHLTKLVGANVSNIDVIDKTLWIASGDPRKLGLVLN